MIAHLFAAALLLAVDPSATVKAHERLREGQRLMAADEFVAGEQAFAGAIALDPLLFMAHYALGTARMALKEYAGAVTAFEAARTAFHDPAAGHAVRRRHRERVLAGRIRQLEDQVRMAPEPTRSRRGREGSSRVVSMEEIVALRRSQQESAQPQLPPGLSLALGSAYFRTGRLADAEREYRAAIDAQRTLGEPHSNLAVVLLITGRPAEAKDQLTLAESSGFKPPAGLKADVDAALANAPRRAP